MKTTEEASLYTPKESLNRVVGKILDYCDGIDINDERWIESYRNQVDIDILRKTHSILTKLMASFSNNFTGDKSND